MRNVWISFAVIVAVAGTAAFSTYRGLSNPTPFTGCFEREGKNIVLLDGRLSIGGVDAGSFQYIRSDATKGPDRISVDARPDLLKTIGVDHRYFWRVAPNGMQLPTGNGEYYTALPCRT